jgi:hypothetical protein
MLIPPSMTYSCSHCIWNAIHRSQEHRWPSSMTVDESYVCSVRVSLVGHIREELPGSLSNCSFRELFMVLVHSDEKPYPEKVFLAISSSACCSGPKYGDSKAQPMNVLIIFSLSPYVVQVFLSIQ